MIRILIVQFCVGNSVEILLYVWEISANKRKSKFPSYHSALYDAANNTVDSLLVYHTGHDTAKTPHNFALSLLIHYYGENTALREILSDSSSIQTQVLPPNQRKALHVLGNRGLSRKMVYCRKLFPEYQACNFYCSNAKPKAQKSTSKLYQIKSFSRVG